MPAHPTPLKFLQPGWFAIPMGLGGLALAWWRAAPLMGEMATVVAVLCALAAAGVFALLLAATLLRWRRYPEAWAEDRRHPVRHVFIATLPLGAMVLGTCGALLLPAREPLAEAAVQALWWAGSAGQLLATWWVLRRWWRPASAGGASWAVVTPALAIPVVGNVLAPIGGVALGHAEWAAAQFGIGVLFWPVVLILLLARVIVQGMFAERLLPTTFIVIAPPALVGLSALAFDAPPTLVWMLWGMALFCFAWVASLAGRLRELPFSLAHWAMSFPLAALATLTLRLATPQGALAVRPDQTHGPLAVLGPALLAFVSIVILALLMATWRGLRDGTLLAPEPVAPIIPIKAAG